MAPTSASAAMKKQELKGRDDEAEVPRRAFLGAFMGLSVIGAADAGALPYDRVERKARELAEAMQEIHGGKWRARVDHETRLVVIIADV